jgi:tetratricopeptide (TPR) repeat protein
MGFLSKIFGIDPETKRRNKFQEIEQRFSGDSEMINFMKATWLTMKGNSFAQHYKFEQAIENFKDAISLDGSHFSASVSLGMVYVQKEMFKEAIGVLSSTPEPSKFYGDDNLLLASSYNRHWVLGVAYKETGNKEQALYHCKKLLEEGALMEAQKGQTMLGVLYEQNKKDVTEKAKIAVQILKQLE